MQQDCILSAVNCAECEAMAKGMYIQGAKIQVF
jgi:hypothetical protein